MDWQCPSFNQVMSEQIESQYGNITAANSIQYITSVEQSGDNRTACVLLAASCQLLAFILCSLVEKVLKTRHPHSESIPSCLGFLQLL